MVELGGADIGVWCVACGEPIGGSDPAWLEDENGARRLTSLLRLDDAAQARLKRGWHLGCVLGHSF
ncbi:MAG: hypothetical protein ACRDLP_07400 [Solirubrobacteraceae bacterium]